MFFVLMKFQELKRLLESGLRIPGAGRLLFPVLCLSKSKSL